MKRIKIIFSLWFIFFAIIFAYVAIFKKNTIWLPTEQTDIDLWKNVLEEGTEVDSAIIQMCLVLNSMAYLVNGIFFMLLMKENSNSKIFVITVIGTVFVGAMANSFVDEYLPWTPPCMIMLTNFLISTIFILFLKKIKS